MAAPIAQAGQGQAHIKPDVVIKSNTPGADGWEVQFGTDATFRDAIIFKNLEPPLQRERAFQLRGKQALFNFRDALVKKVWNPRAGKNMDVRCSALVSARFDYVKVLQNSEQSQSSAWIISFELREDKIFDVKIGQREPPNSNFPQHEITEADVPLWSRREEVQRMRCVRFILPNFQNCGAFKPHTAQAILQGAFEEQPWQSYEEFIRLQHEALQADEKKREEQLKALKRDSVNVQVVPNAAPALAPPSLAQAEPPADETPPLLPRPHFLSRAQNPLLLLSPPLPPRLCPPPAPATSRQDLIAGHLCEVTSLSSQLRTWAKDKLQPALRALWEKEGDMTRLTWDALALGRNPPAPLTDEQFFHLYEYFKLRWEAEQEFKQLQALEL